MICNKCGAENNAGAVSCRRCGAALNRPSAEQVRARIRGEAPARAAVRPAETGETGLLLPAAGVILALLQILFLLLKGAVKAPDVFTGESIPYSLFDGSTILCVLILLLSLCCGAVAALPLVDAERPGARKAAPLLALLNFILGILALNADVKEHTVADAFFETGGVLSQASLGFVGVLFLIVCFASVVVAVLALLSGTGSARPAYSAPAPAQRRAAAQPTAQHRPPARSAASQAGHPRGVTPPDAETIAALRRMAQMHDQGLISDEEFARIKAECVARGWIRG